MKKQEPISPNSYQTGSTNPPKSHQGIIAVLLILVIFLGGIVSILGMMNIRLFQLLEEEKNSSVQFSQISQPEAAAAEALTDGIYAPALGLTGQEITNLYRSYHELPQGLYISEIEPNGPAAKADLRPGDIILTVDGVTVDSEQAMEAVIAGIEPGKSLSVKIFREDQELTVTVIPN